MERGAVALRGEAALHETVHAVRPDLGQVGREHDAGALEVGDPVRASEEQPGLGLAVEPEHGAGPLRDGLDQPRRGDTCLDPARRIGALVPEGDEGEDQGRTEDDPRRQVPRGPCPEQPGKGHEGQHQGEISDQGEVDPGAFAAMRDEPAEGGEFQDRRAHRRQDDQAAGHPHQPGREADAVPAQGCVQDDRHRARSGREGDLVGDEPAEGQQREDEPVATRPPQACRAEAEGRGPHHGGEPEEAPGLELDHEERGPDIAEQDRDGHTEEPRPEGGVEEVPDAGRHEAAGDDDRRGLHHHRPPGRAGPEGGKEFGAAEAQDRGECRVETLQQAVEQRQPEEGSAEPGEEQRGERDPPAAVLRGEDEGEDRDARQTHDRMDQAAEEHEQAREAGSPGGVGRETRQDGGFRQGTGYREGRAQSEHPGWP